MPPFLDPRSTARRRLAWLTVTCSVLAGLLLAACGDNSDGLPVDQEPVDAPAPALTPTAPTTDSNGSTLTPPASPTPTSSPADIQQRLRSHMLSGLAVQTDSAAVRAALEQIEVLSLEFATGNPNLWMVITSGTGIWELPEERTHAAAVYELRPDGTWVEVSSTPLASAPTVGDIELVSRAYEGAAWFAIHGMTGAHSGTFELLNFDGVELTSVLWWFSPMPGAGDLADLDGDGMREVLLNTTDPYVFCYACGVRLWGEVVYRWVGPELTEVPIAAVPHDNPLVEDLTEQAATYAHADLWRQAADTAAQALEIAPAHDEVRWLEIAVSRMANARLVDAGSSPQPLLTWVFAGEYGPAVSLMRAHAPEEVFSSDGPLIAGTAAEGGWEQVTGDYLVDFATRAIEVEADLDSAYAVRALGRVLADPDDWGGALLDMEAALALAPGDTFYAEAVNYLRERSSSTAN